MINKETARAFNDNVCDGFVQPNLAWSATTPNHINGVGGSSITSNFWVGKPEDVKAFAEKIAKFYEEFYNELDEELEDHESISVAYWEKDGIAMCADLCTSDQMYDILPNQFLEEAEKSLRLILSNGNDNDPGLMLKNHDLLSVEERILLAGLMKYDATIRVCEDIYKDEYLINFSNDDIIRLQKALKK